MVIAANELRDSIKMTIEILNNTEGVKRATTFWMSTVTWKQKQTYALVQMPEAAWLLCVSKQVDKMN